MHVKKMSLLNAGKQKRHLDAAKEQVQVCFFFKVKRLSQIWRAQFEGQSSGGFTEKGQLLFVLSPTLSFRCHQSLMSRNARNRLQVKRYKLSR